MGSVVDEWAQDDLASIDRQGLRRSIELVESPQGAVIQIDDERLVNFSSNDYLGLANDVSLTAAATRAFRTRGLGAGASRLVVGSTTAHDSLERAIADFEQTESALLFNSGFAANTGVIPALFGPGDVIFSDALNHASIIDGCRLSRAEVVVYPHADAKTLLHLAQRHLGRRRLVVTDAVFSMDGAQAPLVELAEVCRAENMALMVDEAHATGVLGADGRGLASAVSVTPDIVMGTLSKALGCFGAYVAGSRALRELLINRARSLVYSTALPPALCVAAETALKRVASDKALRLRLWRNIDYFAEGLRAFGVTALARSAIFPIILGSAEAAVEASRELRERGVLVKPIRPPTVPAGTSRLRIALSAAHSLSQLDTLLDGLESIFAARKALGLHISGVVDTLVTDPAELGPITDEIDLAAIADSMRVTDSFDAAAVEAAAAAHDVEHGVSAAS
jgi:8-amino-7-oxononanoate synthase